MTQDGWKKEECLFWNRAFLKQNAFQNSHQAKKGISTNTEMVLFVVKACEADYLHSQLPSGNVMEALHSVRGILCQRITVEPRSSPPGHHPSLSIITRQVVRRDAKNILQTCLNREVVGGTWGKPTPMLNLLIVQSTARQLHQ